MHHGVYQGIEAQNQEKRILILGESHHDKKEKIGEPAPYPTKCIMNTYLEEEKTKNTHHFFHKIARSFGIDTNKKEEKEKFWDKVYFGNYIDVVCSVADGTAKKMVNQKSTCYNKKLKEFVIQEKIDYIFCFGVSAVYNYLPSEEGWDRNAIYPGGKIIVGHTMKNGIEKKVYLRAGIYRQGGYFERKVTVYGIPHPSAKGGFNPDNFAKELSKFF